MKKVILLSFCTVLALSCSKEQVGQFEEPIMGYSESASTPSGAPFTENEFLAIAEGFVGFWSQFRDSKDLDVQTKLKNLQNATSQYSSPIPLSTLAEIYERELHIDDDNVALFLQTLVKYRDIITSDGFSKYFYDELESRVGGDAFSPGGDEIESRWFLATLAAALGAGPCVTGPLAVLDTAAYIATGVLTAPTGIGAVANWGGAVASYGYALSTIGDCP